MSLITTVNTAEYTEQKAQGFRTCLEWLLPSVFVLIIKSNSADMSLEYELYVYYHTVTPLMHEIN